MNRTESFEIKFRLVSRVYQSKFNESTGGSLSVPRLYHIRHPTRRSRSASACVWSHPCLASSTYGTTPARCPGPACPRVRTRRRRRCAHGRYPEHPASTLVPRQTAPQVTLRSGSSAQPGGPSLYIHKLPGPGVTPGRGPPDFAPHRKSGAGSGGRVGLAEAATQAGRVCQPPAQCPAVLAQVPGCQGPARARHWA